MIKATRDHQNIGGLLFFLKHGQLELHQEIFQRQALVKLGLVNNLVQVEQAA